MKTARGSAAPDSQTLLNQIVIEFMREQRRRRRFRWILRLFVLVLIVMGGYQMLREAFETSQARSKPHAGLIYLNGEIADNGDAIADDFARSLDSAYKNNKSLKAIVLRINSPGGSPVQADYMYNQIQFYRGKYPNIPIYAVCVDLCASAAYYVAAAATEIYANPSSMVGSIGVLFNGFGLVDTLHKVGASRRLFVAGKNKGFLDPFSPVDPHQVQFLQTMLNTVHGFFIDKVKAGRGTRLKIDADTFSGLIWVGTQAKDQGLIDGFASAGQVVREKVKVDQVVDYTVKPSLLQRLSNGMTPDILPSKALITPIAAKIVGHGFGRQDYPQF
jgi:protease-4